ncbi:LOW QUALITY PROTEIN: uncharacterized protein LOC117338080 [Pecten maximus]|uniref:LOW QUALITY PROTEIN: uncharacterized protein LOC117338080 n=1 Tax=Pecten maximus TaxID=6579 RepID=UPI001458DF10|nr:LOW QUALITY PROTEIN: uncharacterized protein LOC117338080 [Pecten maximus]
MSADDITDIHICGACRTEFHNVDLFLLHKRLSCPAVLQSAVTGTVPSHKDGVAGDNQQQIPVSKDNCSMVTTSLGANMGIQVQSSGLAVVQGLHMGTSHPGEREGVRSTFMITPPQGHEYIQTNQRPALIQTNNQNKSESQIILTEKGELLVVQTTPPDGTEPNETEMNQHGQAMLNFIQYIRANGGGTTNIAGPILPNLVPTTEGMAHPSSAPIVQLRQNGSVSIVSTPESQPLTVCPSDLHNGNLVDQTTQRHLIENSPQVTFDQESRLDGNDPIIRPVVQAQDLAQQAARLSGVVESDLQSVPMETNTQQSDLDTVQYSVNVVNINQSANTEGVGQILQIPESNIQEENIVFSDNLGQPLSESHKFGKFSGKTVIARGAKTHCSSSKNSSKSSSTTKPTGSPNKSPGTAHKVRTPPVKKFKCHYDDKCTFSSAYLKDLERHFRTHTGEKPFSCKYCDRSFSRVDKLHLHMRAHTGDKPYKCKFCNYSAVDNSSLRKHAIVHTDERPHKCQVCPYACRTASQLTVHLRTHTGDSPFPCPFCPAKFKIKSDLRRHLRVHTGEKPYQCDKCDAKCATKGNLASHNRVHHSTENQMKCTVCDFSTSSKRSYKEHIKGHEPDDPDCVCHVCQYKCSNREVLRSHLSRHEKEKSYSCMHCYFSTNHKANLTLHIKRRHMQIEPKVVNTKGRRTKSSEVKVSGSSGKFSKSFTCHLCPESFVRKDSLRSHIRLHEEMANSTLTTALTVLKLQQPVINVSSSGSHNRVAPVSDEGIVDGSSDMDPKGQEQVMMHYGTDSAPITSASSANDREENGRYVDGACHGQSQSQSREGHSEVTQELVQGQDRLEYHREELQNQNMDIMNLQAPELSQIVSSGYNTSTQRVQTSPDSTVITLDMRTLSSDDITIVEPQGIAEARKMLLHKQVLGQQQIRVIQDKEDDLSNQQMYRQLSVSDPDVPCDVQIRSSSGTTNTYYPNSHITKREAIERRDCGSDSDGYRREMYTGSVTSGNLLETENPRCVLQNVMECPETSVSDRVQFQTQTIPSIQLVQNISFPVIRHPAGLIIPSVNGQSLNQLVGGTIHPGDITTLPQGEITTLTPGDVTTIQRRDSTTLPQSIHSFQQKGTLQNEGIHTLQQGDITVIQQRGITTLQQTEGTNPLSLNAQLQDGDTHLNLPIQILPQQTGSQSFQMIGGVSQLMNTASTSVQLVLPTTVDNSSATGQKVVATSIRQIENPVQSNTMCGIPHELSSSIRGHELNVSSSQLSEVDTGQVTMASNQTQVGSCVDDVKGLMGQKVNSLNKRVIIPMSVPQTGGLIINSPVESHALTTGKSCPHHAFGIANSKRPYIDCGNTDVTGGRSCPDFVCGIKDASDRKPIPKLVYCSTDVINKKPS